ncbi:hypothetical protein CN137_31330 [Sinorhizobium meliloti]|nr:hypothetical protein CN137_31330 [Sinorhizobium meliloti]
MAAESEKYSYASLGNGTPLHRSGELFKKMAGVEMQPIRYKGSGPAGMPSPPRLPVAHVTG